MPDRDTLHGHELLLLLACASPKTGTVMTLLGDYPAGIGKLRERYLIDGHGVDLKLSDRGECYYAGLLATRLPVAVIRPTWEIPKP